MKSSPSRGVARPESESDLSAVSVRAGQVIPSVHGPARLFRPVIGRPDSQP